MKSYEKLSDSIVVPNVSTIIRVDGHNFSKFTKKFKKPFDEILHRCMVSTAENLLDYHSNATTAYTQSDEISLIFPDGIIDYAGRIQKLVSLTAAYASVRFNHWLSHYKIKEVGIAHFDARIFVLPKPEEILNNILWRSQYDCQRNSKAAFARSYFSAKTLHRVNTDDQIKKVLDERGIHYESEVPQWARFGTIVKKESYEIKGLNPVGGESIMAMRTRYRAKDIVIDRFSAENLELLVSKKWPSMYKDKSDEDIFQIDVE